MPTLTQDTWQPETRETRQENQGAFLSPQENIQDLTQHLAEEGLSRGLTYLVNELGNRWLEAGDLPESELQKRTQGAFNQAWQGGGSLLPDGGTGGGTGGGSGGGSSAWDPTKTNPTMGDFDRLLQTADPPQNRPRIPPNVQQVVSPEDWNKLQQQSSELPSRLLGELENLTVADEVDEKYLRSIFQEYGVEWQEPPSTKYMEYDEYEEYDETLDDPPHRQRNPRSLDPVKSVADNDGPWRTFRKWVSDTPTGKILREIPILDVAIPVILPTYVEPGYFDDMWGSDGTLGWSGDHNSKGMDGTPMFPSERDCKFWTNSPFCKSAIANLIDLIDISPISLEVFTDGCQTVWGVTFGFSLVQIPGVYFGKRNPDCPASNEVPPDLFVPPEPTPYTPDWKYTEEWTIPEGKKCTFLHEEAFTYKAVGYYRGGNNPEYPPGFYQWIDDPSFSGSNSYTFEVYGGQTIAFHRSWGGGQFMLTYNGLSLGFATYKTIEGGGNITGVGIELFSYSYGEGRRTISRRLDSFNVGARSITKEIAQELGFYYFAGYIFVNVPVGKMKLSSITCEDYRTKPKPRPPLPLPPPPMTCCNQSSQLLGKLLKEVKDLREKETGPLHKRYVGDNWGKDGVSMPEALFGKGDKQVMLTTWPEWFAWFVLQFDSLVGQWPVEIEVENEEKKKQKLQIPNLAEGIAELYGLGAGTALDSDVSVAILLRMVAEIIAIKSIDLSTSDYVRAIADFLNFPGKEVKRDLPLNFTIGTQKGEIYERPQDVRTVLQPSTAVTRGYEFVGDSDATLVEALKKLLYAAAITKAAHVRGGEETKPQQRRDLLGTLGDVASVVAAGASVANLVRGNGEQVPVYTWDEFIAQLKDPDSALNRGWPAPDATVTDDPTAGQGSGPQQGTSIGSQGLNQPRTGGAN